MLSVHPLGAICLSMMLFEMVSFTRHMWLYCWAASLTISVAVLPPGTRVNLVLSHGMSAWSFTIKIEGVDKEGNPVAYFSKVSRLALFLSLWTLTLSSWLMSSHVVCRR